MRAKKSLSSAFETILSETVYGPFPIISSCKGIACAMYLNHYVLY